MIELLTGFTGFNPIYKILCQCLFPCLELNLCRWCLKNKLLFSSFKNIYNLNDILYQLEVKVLFNKVISIVSSGLMILTFKLIKA